MLGRNETRERIPGPVGALEAIVTDADIDSPGHFAVVGHPHPLMGGTMQNKVVHTVSRALRERGIPSIRFNFRGTGASEGEYDEGKGETDDFIAAVRWGESRWPGAPLLLAGFSFGSFVAANAAIRLQTETVISRLMLIAPPVERMPFGELPELAMPTLVIQGEDDEVVDPPEVYRWAERRGLNVTVEKVAGTGHFFHGCLPQLKQLIQQYL